LAASDLSPSSRLAYKFLPRASPSPGTTSAARSR